jgi:hypothetical protein
MKERKYSKANSLKQWCFEIDKLQYHNILVASKQIILILEMLKC